MPRIRLMSLLLCVALLFNACGGPEAEDENDAPLPDVSPAPLAAATAAPTGTQTTITFGAQDHKRSTYEPLIKLFNAENPDIQVVFVSLDEVLREGNSNAYTFDTSKIVRAADTAETFGVNLSDVTQGLFHDLQPFIDADPTFDRNDFFPAALQPIEGRLYGIPTAINLDLLQYNRDLWDAAGLPTPTLDWSFADFSAALAALAKKDGDTITQYGLVGWGSEYNFMSGALASAGINVREPTDATKLTDPKVIAALERTVEYGKNGAIFTQAPEQTNAWDDMRALIIEGRAGMWQGGMGFGGQNNELAFETAYALWPAEILDGQNGSGENLIMSAGTQSPDAAWRWLSFLSSQEIKEPFSIDRGPTRVPARKSLAEGTGYWKKLDPATTEVVRASLERTPPTDLADSAGFFVPLNEAFQAAVKGTDAATAARDAQAKREASALAVVATPAVEPTGMPVVVATPQVQVAAEGATKIVFAVPYNIGTLAKSARAFNDANPDVFIEIKVTTPTSSTLGLQELARDSDCFSWFSMPAEKDQPLALDLQPLIDADASFERDDYPPVLLDVYRDGSKLLGLPSMIMFPVVNYNKAMFEDAGVALPAADWTLETMIDAAKQLTSGEGDAKRYGYASMGGLSHDMQLFISLAGASMFTSTGDAAEPNFTDPQVANAIRSFIDLLKTTSPHEQIDGYKQGLVMGGSAWEMMNEGKIGLWTQYGLSSPGLMGGDSPAFTIAVAPLPTAQNLLSTDQIIVDALLISATSQHAQSCWQWFKYLSNDMSYIENSFPARLSVATSDAFLRDKPEGTDQVVRSVTAALNKTSKMTPPWWQSDLDPYWLYQAADRALQGGDLDKELAAAQQTTTDFMACVRGGETPAVCAKQVDPKYDGWHSAEPE